MVVGWHGEWELHGAREQARKSISCIELAQKKRGEIPIFKMRKNEKNTEKMRVFRESGEKPCLALLRVRGSKTGLLVGFKGSLKPVLKGIF
jgi:hypothetical protein